MTEHNPATHPTRDDFRDAVGWLIVSHQQDTASKVALANMCDPVGLVDALTAMMLGLVNISTCGNPQLYLDHMRDHIDEYVDRLEGGAE